MATHWRMRHSFSLLAALFVTAAGAATEPVPVAGQEEPLQELDEVEVTSTRLWKMRAQLVELEEKFNALYNELNENDDFDVVCRMEAPLGTRIRKRICKVAFYVEAEVERAQAILTGHFAPDPQVVALERQAEYRAAAVEVIKSDKRLLRLIEERIALEERYKAERKRRFKGRWFLFD
jgi:hypothetical protein